jgi:multidrug efflux pump subunit AcrA (membrane-fusion protein)
MADSRAVRDTTTTTSLETTDPSTGWVDDFEFDRSLDEPVGRRRWLRWLIVPVIALLIAGAAIWVTNPFGTTAAALVTAKSTTGTVVSSVSVSGSVASSTIDELNFGSAGTVTAVNVAPGDKVTAGQVLATIDDSAQQVQLTTAQANLESAQARLATDLAGPTAATKASAQDSVKQAELQLSTAKQSLSDTYASNNLSISQANAAVTAAKAQLADDKAATPVVPATIARDQAAVTSAQAGVTAARLKATLSVHQAQNQVNSASLGVTTAKHNYALKIVATTPSQIAADKAAVAQAQQALTTLQQTGSSLTAPVAGTVTVVNLKVGQSVSGSSGSSASGSGSSSSSSTAGQIEVMDLAKLQIAGQASETDVAKLKMGQPATITASALGSESVVGKVCALSVVGTQISGVTSFGVTVCLDGANPSLLVGMSATAAVVTSRADNAVLVPSLAVKTVGGQQVVAILGADGKTQTNVPVTVGISNGSQTQILSGLNEGATVVESIQTTTTNRPGGGNNRGGFPGGGGGFGGG